jgi:hypothetical protein
MMPVHGTHYILLEGENMEAITGSIAELTAKFEEIFGELIDFIVGLSAGSSAPEAPETTPPTPPTA